MLYFIVSGYVPGTDIQITFDMLMVFIASFSTVLLLSVLIRNTVKDTLDLRETVQNLEEVAL